MSNDQPTPKEFMLFRMTDEKIEKLKIEMSHFNELMTEQRTKIDRLTDRVDHGVSVTGQKTLEKVTDLVTQVSAFAVDLEKKQAMIAILSEQIKAMHTWVFWVAFAGVLGGIISVAFRVISK